jgi:hypothetical protein
MFGRRRAAPATPNLEVETIPVFAPDARGAALFHGITAGNASRLNSAVRIDARGDGTWGGWTKAPQIVQAPTGRLGSARPVVEHGATIDQASGTVLSDSMQRVFTERMARGLS